jgi:hypothetical protein
MPGLFDVPVRDRVEHLAVGLRGELADHVAAGPSRHAVAILALRFVRVDAAREQLLEAGVDARAPESALHQRVEAERGQVPLVEHDGVPQRDRPLVVGLGRHQVENRPRALAVAGIPGGELFTVEAPAGICRGGHIRHCVQFFNNGATGSASDSTTSCHNGGTPLPTLSTRLLIGAVAAPALPDYERAFATSPSRSIGSGKMIVEFCSAAISFSVWR